MCDIAALAALVAPTFVAARSSDYRQQQRSLSGWDMGGTASNRGKLKDVVSVEAVVFATVMPRSAVARGNWQRELERTLQVSLLFNDISRGFVQLSGDYGSEAF
jgi:hypothetical protein